jgi:hypothetical protein
MAKNPDKLFKNRVFIQTFSTLSPTEIRQFTAFCAQSSAVSKEIKALLVFIADSYPHFEKITDHQVLSKFFSNHSQPKIQLNYALHELLALLQNWLVQQELEADDYLRQQLLLRAYKKRFLHQRFFKQTRLTLNGLATDSLNIPDTWYKVFETNSQLFYHIQTLKNQEVVESLTGMENHLELFYHGTKIRLFCQQIRRKQVFTNLPEINKEELKQTLSFAQKHQENVPFFALYLPIVHLIQKPDLPYLIEFIEIFKKKRTQIKRLDQSILFYTTANLLNEPTIKGNELALQTQFDLYQYAFAHDLVLFDNEMSSALFNNFLIVACMFNESKMAQKILTKYAPYFNPTIREDFINLMQCTIYFYQKKYGKVELNRNKFQFKDPRFRIRSRNLFLKNLYERYQKDEHLKPVLLAELVKLKKYIQQQHSLSKAAKNRYNTMILVVRKLTNGRHTRLHHRAKIKKELFDFLNDATTQLISFDWLSEKVKEL